RIGEPVSVLVHFDRLPTDKQRLLLSENGITLMDYLPDNTFSAIVRPPLNTEAVLSLPVHSILNVVPEWKAGNYLWRQVSNNKSKIEILVSFYPFINVDEIKQFITSMGGQLKPGHIEKYGSYKV